MLRLAAPAQPMLTSMGWMRDCCEKSWIFQGIMVEKSSVYLWHCKRDIRIAINNRCRVSYLEKAHNILYITLKAKINHSVGLIHTEVLVTVEVNFSLLQYVDYAPRSCNHDVNSFAGQNAVSKVW